MYSYVAQALLSSSLFNATSSLLPAGMKPFSLFLGATTATAASTVNFAHWRAPDGDVAVRSPCPILNTLANHNILPWDGHNYTVPLLVAAFGSALNVSAEVAARIAASGLFVARDPASGMFDLDELNKHNIIEHDASLSRPDVALGDGSQAFDAAVWAETLGYFGNVTEVGIKEVAAARWGRVQASRRDNDKFTYGDTQRFSSYFESAAYWQILRDAKTGKARVEWIDILFRKLARHVSCGECEANVVCVAGQERLPWNEGWRPVNRMDGFSTAQVTLQMALNTPEKM
jgi:hypothetical protein